MESTAFVNHSASIKAKCVLKERERCGDQLDDSRASKVEYLTVFFKRWKMSTPLKQKIENIILDVRPLNRTWAQGYAFSLLPHSS